MKTYRAIDPTTLPRHLDAQDIEARCARLWEDLGTYHYDPSRPREETFVVDTPPPTVSGSLHIGHVFSYTQTDVVTRYQRMRGRNIYYPMGWDDNGLPTERRVQNLYHVRVSVDVPYEEGLSLEEASAKKRKKERPRTVSRPNFIELCHEVTLRDEQAFKELFTRLGLSVDWREEYATIDDRCRKLAQLSFLDLYEKGHVYSSGAPTMWDVDFQTAVAQAEVEDREEAGAMHDIAFAVEDSGESFVIGTTRPELLAACVAVTAHPDDDRYRHLFGKNAITPLFHVPVRIFPSELADPEKGTGILMVCTFGDATDVLWWREQDLPLRQVVGRDGRLLPVEYGTPGWESRDPEMANRCYAALVGKNIRQAKAAVVEMLRDESLASARGRGAPLQGQPRPIHRPVKFFEKGDKPLEFVPTRQWFVRLLDRKEELLEMGRSIAWHPGFMATRYLNWTEGLQLDWCISRQRYFGVQFPVWYHLDDQGEPIYDDPILAHPEDLPVDPTVDCPAGHSPETRGKPGGFTAEADVFDTWFTSSLTPQIGSHWIMDERRHQKLFPADIRPQSHEIIRTWAFYTIAKAMLHEDTVPWHHVLVSGWILDPDRKKMSKSKGNVVTPIHLLDKYTSDGVRYWAASARLGADTAFDEKVLKVGKRLVTKVFNASKFVLAQGAEVHPIAHELDRSFIQKLGDLIDEATEKFEAYDYAGALAATESFFWASFTDTYLELTKKRARGESSLGASGAGSAVGSLRIGLSVLLRLLAPIVPYITEEVWSWCFAEEAGHPSIHAAPWPTREELSEVAPPSYEFSLQMASAAMATINKRKSELSVSLARGVDHLTLAASPRTLERLNAVLEDVMSTARVERYDLVKAPELDHDVFRIEHLALAEAK